MKVKKWAKFKKSFKKLFQRRPASNKDLADAIVDCFRNDDGTLGFKSNSFRDSSGTMVDNDGNSVFYPKVYVDAACSRIDDLVNQLRNGQEITQPDMIPKVILKGYNRDDEIMRAIKKSVICGTKEEMVWRNCLQNGHAVDREMIKFIVHHLNRDLLQSTDGKIIDDFADAMKAKMQLSEQNGKHDWEICPNDDLRQLLNDAILKGDPVDVANYAMMLHFKGETTSPQPIEFTFAPKDSENDVTD